MSNNTTLDPGTGGDTIATDDVAGVKYERVKLTDGTEDSTTAIASGGGVEANALRVTVASDSTGVVSVDDNGGNLSIDDGGNSITVDNATISVVGGGVEATAQRVTLASDSTGVLSVDDNGSTLSVDDGAGSLTVDNGGTFAVQDSEKVADDAAFTVGTTKVQPVGYLADQAATDSVNEGDIGAARITFDRKQIVTIAPSADTEGLSIAKNLDIDETEDAIKATAGKLYGWYMYNDAATEVYVKFYNDTVANVVVGTTVPVMTIPVPAGAAANVEFANGIAFSAAITVAATTAVADNDTGAPALNSCVGNFFYQ